VDTLFLELIHGVGADVGVRLQLMAMSLTFHERVLLLQIHLGEKKAACDAVMESLEPNGVLFYMLATIVSMQVHKQSTVACD